MSSNLRIGTSGWNYPTGRGTWNGIFYPPARQRPKGFDELRFYAEHFNTVEVNATFYGQPRPEACRSWAERTPPGFEFSIKLYQKFTHPRMYQERVSHVLASGLGTPGEPDVVEALAKPTETDLDQFRRGIDPLATSGKLGAVLAQFPPSFKDTAESREYLAQLLHVFDDYPIAVELRHKSWSDAVGDTLAMLNAFGAAWVQIDEPKFQFSIRQNYLPNVKTFYYMRLHGRNAKQWWRHDATEDRYNYLYSGKELQEFADIAGAAKALVRKSYLYTNNHFASKSVVNAVMIKAQLGEPIEGEYPPELIERYPDLEDLVTTGRVRVAATSSRSASRLPV